MAIVLANTDESLEIYQAESPTVDPSFICTFTDYTTIGKPDRQIGTLTDGGDTTIVSAPGASTQRVIETVCINNLDAAAITLTPMFDEAGTEYPFGTFTVNPGEQLIYTQGKWQVISSASSNRLFAATLGSTQSNIANGTNTQVQFDTEVYDPNSEFASYKHTPKVAGYYLYSAQVYWADIDDGNYAYAGLGKNWASGAPTYQLALRASGAATDVIINITRLVYMNGSTDFMTVVASHLNGDATPDITANASFTWFSGVRVSP
jgi:hypothetical protein